MAHGRLLSFVYGASLVPGAQAMSPVDGFEDLQARDDLQGCTLCGMAGFALKSGHSIEDMWEMIARTPQPEPRACLLSWMGHILSKLHSKRPGPLRVG